MFPGEDGSLFAKGGHYEATLLVVQRKYSIYTLQSCIWAFRTKTLVKLYIKRDMEKIPDWQPGVSVYSGTLTLQYNFVLIIVHDQIRSLFRICALADNSSATFLGNTIRNGVFPSHMNGYLISSLTTSIIDHSLSDFCCIALTPKFLCTQ